MKKMMGIILIIAMSMACTPVGQMMPLTRWRMLYRAAFHNENK